MALQFMPLLLTYQSSRHNLNPHGMSKITLQVEQDEDSGWYVASWEAPSGQGGITTQGQDLQELQANVREAVRCHFEPDQMPKEISLHFLADPVLTAA